MTTAPTHTHFDNNRLIVRCCYLGMFILIACISALAGLLTTQFPACPSPRKILERLDRSRADL